MYCFLPILIVIGSGIVLVIADCKKEERKADSSVDPANIAFAKVVLENPAGLIWVRSWIKEDRQRVALTCYEWDPGQCRRLRVARAVEPGLGKKHKTEHL